MKKKILEVLFCKHEVLIYSEKENILECPFCGEVMSLKRYSKQKNKEKQHIIKFDDFPNFKGPTYKEIRLYKALSKNQDVSTAKMIKCFEGDIKEIYEYEKRKQKKKRLIY